MPKSKEELIASYERIASRYAEEFFTELADKPEDLEVIGRFADSIRVGGTVLDIGCGPGQVVQALRDKGVDVVGVDLCEKMLDEARQRLPEVRFEKGDFTALDWPDGSAAGIVGFYAIIHLDRDDLEQALREFFRVLEPGGRLLLSFHGGKGKARADEWFGEPVIIDATFFEADEMSEVLARCGFEVEDAHQRAPLPLEFPVPRVFAFAKKPE